jgi:hypothetical protein
MALKIFCFRIKISLQTQAYVIYYNILVINLKTLKYIANRPQVIIATFKRLFATNQKPHLPRRYVSVYVYCKSAGKLTSRQNSSVVFLTLMYLYVSHPFLNVSDFRLY